MQRLKAEVQVWEGSDKIITIGDPEHHGWNTHAPIGGALSSTEAAVVCQWLNHGGLAEILRRWNPDPDEYVTGREAGGCEIHKEALQE